MKIQSLKLQNWRNHKNYKIEFQDINIMIGNNASGKTNLLEAVHYLAVGKSFRTKDDFLINWDEDFLRLEANVLKEDKNLELVAVIEKNKNPQKIIKINNQKVASSKLLSNLNCVLFTPEEIEMLYSSPEARRRYLNLIISQSSQKYAYSLMHYRRTLEQRNSLLKRINVGIAKEDELEIWDGKLAEYAEEIITARERYINNININISKHYQTLSGDNSHLNIIYKPSVSVSNGWAGIVQKLLNNRAKDVLCRITNIGPHRDDILFEVDGKNVLEFASRGEFRTVILALKLSEIDYLKEITGELPVLLLDDVFSELDENRRNLLSQIFENQQTIVTTTDMDHVSDNIIKRANVINIG